MALTSLASELMDSLNVYEYRKYIPAVHAGTGVTQAMFAAMPDSDNYTVNTSRTYKGKRSKVLNPDLFFEIFGVYNGETPDVVRAMMLKWIRDNTKTFDTAVGLSMIGKEIELETWMVNMSSSRTPGDEFALYALCRLYTRHACIVNTGRLWHTCSPEGLPDDKTIKEICDLRFIQICRDTYGLLCPKAGEPGYMAGQVIAEGSVVGMLRKVEAGDIKLPLGLHNQNLPDDTKFPIVPLPLPYELDSGDKIEAPQNRLDVLLTDEILPLNIDDGATLPDDTLNQDLGASVPPGDNNEMLDTLPDDTPIKEPNVIPCSIKIRKLTDADVNLWKSKPKLVPTVPLPDETDEIDKPNDSEPDNKPDDTPRARIVAGYGLRNRPKPLSTNRTGMARACKNKVTFAGVFSTDESSQDSRIPDDEGDPSPFVKITGLSEPSPYRLAAQKFIDAQRKGLTPPPPNQSLPGLKVKSPEQSEADPDDASNESNASTIPYDPDEASREILPEETQEDHDTEIPVKKRVVTGFKIYGIRKPKLNTKCRKFRCVRCKRLFDSVGELNEHFINKHRRLKCNQCGKLFDKPRSYEKHQYAHVSKPHKCDICGKGFTFQSHLKTHQLCHNPPKQFTCNKRNCNRGYSSKSDLKKHEKTHTAKWIRCKHEGCTYKTKDLRNYNTHQKTHTQKKGHKCPFCGKGFIHSNQLTRHKKVCIKVERSDSPTF